MAWNGISKVLTLQKAISYPCMAFGHVLGKAIALLTPENGAILAPTHENVEKGVQNGPFRHFRLHLIRMFLGTKNKLMLF